MSLEYALNYHGLTPEGSAVLTSVSTKRGRQFQTPVGLFLYRTIPEAGFHVGVQRVELEDGRRFSSPGRKRLWSTGSAATGAYSCAPGEVAWNICLIHCGLQLRI